MSLELKSKLCWLLILLFTSLQAEIITIGSGNYLNNGLPIEPVATFSYSQQLFLPSEIGCSGLITAIGFQYNVNSNLFYNGNKNWKVYLGHSSIAALDNWLPVDSMQLVYDNIIPENAFSNGLPGSGWLNINLETPFVYNGTQALLIGIDENTIGSGSTSDDFRCSSYSSFYAIQFQHSTINPDPNAPPTTGWTLKNFRSNLQITIEAQYYTPVQPNPFNGEINVPIDANLSWNSNGSNFSLVLGNNPDSLVQVINNTALTYWQPENPFQFNRTYYWRVTAYANSVAYPSVLWSFTTLAEQISPPQNLTGCYTEPAIELNWNPPPTNNQHHYNIYRNAGLLASTTNQQYSDANVQSGTSYNYWITAVSNSGTESYPSNSITVTIPSQSAEQIMFQGFENVPAFTEDIFAWQNLDLDDSVTSEWEGISFPAETEPFGWLCFEPLATIPPLMDQPTFAGTKMLASLCAIPPPNNDWFISPPIHLGTNSRLNFAAKSAFANFGLERLCVLISNTNSEIASFTPLNSGPYIAVPVQWTNYAYDLSAWDGQRIFLAWRCVSVDAMALFLDNIEVYSHSGWVRNEDLVSPVSEFSLFPNPCKGSFTLQNKSGENFHLEIYNLKGQCLFQQNASKNFDSQTELAPLACGIYFLRLDQNGKKETLKLSVIK